MSAGDAAAGNSEAERRLQGSADVADSVTEGKVEMDWVEDEGLVTIGERGGRRRRTRAGRG